MSDEKRAGKALLWKGMQLGVSKVVYLVGTLILGHLLAPKEFGLVAIATVAIPAARAACGRNCAISASSSRAR